MQGWWSPRASADGPEQHVGEEREAEVGGLEKKVLDQQTEIGRLRAQLQRMETDLLSLGAPSQPPALLPRKPLSKVEGLIDERIRTLCLVVCALAVLYFAMWTLSDVLILFFLAVALKYLLTPLIDFLSCRHPRSVRYADRCPVQLGRKWAVLFALLIAVVVLLAVSFIVANSLSSFAARAGMYNARIEELIDYAFNEVHRLEIEWGMVNASDVSEAKQMSHLAELEKEMAAQLDVSDIIVRFLGSASGVLEDVIYVLLFLVFMLVEGTAEDNGRSRVAASPADQKIFDYIGGKVLLSTLVGLLHAVVLTAVGLEMGLSLVFGLLTFWLNFIPAVGAPLGVLLPMPFVALDPRFSTYQIAIAFVAPMALAFVNKDVIEPKVFANSTNLEPVMVMLAILLWGSVWGITGMVLAVPITAVIRIYLENVEHPLTRYLALSLGGKPAGLSRSASSSDTSTGLVFGATLPEEAQAHEDRQRLLEGRDATSLV